MKVFLKAAHRLQHRIVLALRVDAPGCQVYSGPQNRQAYHDQVIQPGLTPFKLFFCWCRSLKGSGRKLYREVFRLITLITHSKTFHAESAVCSDPLNLFKGPLAVLFSLNHDLGAIKLSHCWSQLIPLPLVPLSRYVCRRGLNFSSERQKNTKLAM